MCVSILGGWSLAQCLAYTGAQIVQCKESSLLFPFFPPNSDKALDSDVVQGTVVFSEVQWGSPSGGGD